MEPDDVGVAVVDVLRPTIAALTDEVLSSVVEAVPPFTEWWGGTLDVRDGVDHGIRGFLELLEGGGAADATGARLPNHDVFFAFGRSELRAGARSAARWPPTASARRRRGARWSPAATRPGSRPRTSTRSPTRSSPTSTASAR